MWGAVSGYKRRKISTRFLAYTFLDLYSTYSAPEFTFDCCEMAASLGCLPLIDKLLTTCKDRRNFGGCHRPTMISPWFFPRERNIAMHIASTWVSALYLVQCTSTIAMIWSLFNLQVVQRQSWIKDISKHHLGCYGGHSLLYLPFLMSLECACVYWMM